MNIVKWDSRLYEKAGVFICHKLKDGYVIITKTGGSQNGNHRLKVMAFLVHIRKTELSASLKAKKLVFGVLNMLDDTVASHYY